MADQCEQDPVALERREADRQEAISRQDEAIARQEAARTAAAKSRIERRLLWPSAVISLLLGLTGIAAVANAFKQFFSDG